MPQDAFHIRRLSDELRRFLVGGKINRITQVDKDELTFIVYVQKTTVKVIVSANATGARVCLAAEEKEGAAVAPNFCMLLRKHLQGAEIVDIRQCGEERILALTLHCTSDFSSCDRVLYCELMGKYSNVILTENGIVLGALKTTALSDEGHRVLLSGARYVLPEPQEKLSPLDEGGMQTLFENFFATHADGYDEESLARFVFENVAGFALSTAREIARRQRNREFSEPLSAFIPRFFTDEPNEPHLQTDDEGRPKDFFAFAVKDGRSMPSLCKAEDELFYYKETRRAFENETRRLESVVRALKKKATKRLQDVCERLQEAENAEENRVKGELLTANLYAVQKGDRAIEVQNWYDERGGTIKIGLDESLSPSKNAQRYFKTYNKQKRAKEILTPMRDKEEAELAYLESIFASLSVAESREDLAEIRTELIALGALKPPQVRTGKKNAKPTEIPFREYEHDGHCILVGRNNVQNDRLVRFASSEDVWLHTQKYHSSHVIIVEGGRQVRDETLVFAAELCAYYSDGRNGDKIPVDYCKRKFVKKPSKSKLGFVIYTEYKTLLVTPNAHKTV